MKPQGRFVDHGRNGVLLALAAGLAASVAAQPAEQPAAASGVKLGKTPINRVVAAMTLEEKAALVVGTGRMGFPPPSTASGAPGAPAAAGTPAQAPAPAAPATGMIGATQSLVPGAAGTTYAVPRLGITPSVLADGPAGLRISPTRPNDKSTYYATAFPVGTLLASSWDTELVTRVGQATGKEVLEYGVDVLLGPGMNIHRNPLCGRNFEYYSEDPLLTGKMAAAMVNGVQSNGVGTSIKHFAANNAETARNVLDTQVSERALREIYLEGFRIAVQEAQPWTVMTSYNLINGTYAPESHDLVTAILRGDWNFTGYVMTDWGGGRDPVAQVAAGNDLIMPGSPAQIEQIVKAVKEGKLDVRSLDRNAERFLNVLVRGPRFKGYAFSNKPDLKANAEVARQASTEGMVLLKNDNKTLPPGKDVKTIAGFGNASYEIISGGTGSGDVNEAYTVSLQDALPLAGYALNADLQALYVGYIKLVKAGRPAPTGRMMFRSASIAELEVPADLVNSMANLSDLAIGVKPAYEFGYGLSYTTFEYGAPKLSSPRFDAKMTLSVDVKNAGAVAGKEVVQLYLTAPAKTLDKPAQELRGFAKTKLLGPGESQTLTFVLDGRSLASFDPALSAWVADAGEYQVKLGASSRDIRQTAAFTLGKDTVVEKEARALVPKEKIAELKAPARK